MKIKMFLFLALAFFAVGNIQAQAVAPNQTDYEKNTPPGMEDVAPPQTPEETVKPSVDSLQNWIQSVKSWFVGGGDPIDSPTEFNGRVYVVDMILTMLLGFVSLLIPGINKIPRQRYRMFAIVLVLVGGFSYGLNLSLVQILGLIGSSGLAMFIYKEWIAPLVKSEDVSKIILEFLGQKTS